MILVTGGAGFIGSHLVTALAGRGRTVRVLDDFSTGHEENLAPVAGRVEVVAGSITDRTRVREALRDVEAVFHLAACASVERSVREPLAVHEVNATGTLVMLEEAARAGVHRLLFASSASVYGDAGEEPCREDRRPDPHSPYAAQKLLGEHYCRVFWTLRGLSTVVLRYYNVFGPRQDPRSPYSGVISIFCDRLLQDQPTEIHGDGGQTRDFTYVTDVVAANLLALEADLPGGTVLNVAAGRPVSVREVHDEIARLCDRTREPASGPPRVGDVRHSRADLGRAREILGYRPEVSLEEGLRRTLDSLAPRIDGAEQEGQR